MRGKKTFDVDNKTGIERSDVNEKDKLRKEILERKKTVRDERNQ